MNKEIWKDIPKYEEYYQVSNMGRVKSLSRIKYYFGKYPQKTKERILKQIIVNGYPTVNLCKDGKMIPTQYVHDLVLLAFVGKKPKGMECCHWDGTRDNNKLKNLRYGTRKENLVDDEMRLKGKLTAQKLFPDDVKKIKYLLCNTVCPKKISQKFNIGRTLVREIITGKAYKEVPWPHIPRTFYKKPIVTSGLKIHKGGKLNTESIKEIKKMLTETNLGVCKIAEMFNIDKAIVSRIKNKKIWFNV